MRRGASSGLKIRADEVQKLKQPGRAVWRALLQQLHEEELGGRGELRRSYRWQPHSQVVLQGSAVL